MEEKDPAIRKERQDEIKAVQNDAKKSFSFEYDLYPSRSEGDGHVLKINKYKKL